MSLSLWKKRAPSSALAPFGGELARLRDEMDRAFDRFFTDPFAIGAVEPKSLRANGWIPPLDVSESDKEVTIRAEIPGIAAKDLEITVTGNTLVIAGEKQEQDEKKDENYYQCECRFGSFRRAIDLPDTVDADKVTAESDNGVVTVHVAKKPGAKPKQIEVKPAAKRIAVSG